MKGLMNGVLKKRGSLVNVFPVNDKKSNLSTNVLPLQSMVEADNCVHNDGRPLEIMSFTFCIKKFARQKNITMTFKKLRITNLLSGKDNPLAFVNKKLIASDGSV